MADIDATVDFGGATAGSYVATLRLPSGIAQQLANTDSAPPVTVEFGDGGAGVLTVGGERYELRTRSEASEVLCISEERGACATVGRVSECLEVQATLDGEARERVKRRSEQAEREKKEAHRTIYDDGSKPAKKARAGAAAKKPATARAKPAAAAAPAAARKAGAASSSSSGAAPAAARGGGGGGSASSAAGAEAKAREWVVHVLALAPAQVETLEKQARDAERTDARLPRGLAAKVRAALNLVAERGDEGRYKLLESARAEVSEQWPHYTQQQRANLAANNAMRGAAARGAAAAPAAAPARRSGGGGGGRGGGGGPSSQPPQPQPPLVVRTQEEFRRYKKEFNKKYPRYEQLGRELDAITGAFHELDQQFQAATDEKERARLSKELERKLKAEEPVLRAKADERRALHVELDRLKEGVNAFAEGRENRA